MAPMEEKDAHTWGMAAHLSGLIGFLGPLIIWLIKKNEHPFVDEQGKEALNFQISILIYQIVAFILAFVVIGGLLLPIIWLAWLILLIIATVKVSKGESYRYPLTIRLVK